MADETTQKTLVANERRIREAVALGTPDRIPVIPNGPAWAARITGTKISEVCTNPAAAYRILIDAYTSLGDIDAFQHASYT